MVTNPPIHTSDPHNEGLSQSMLLLQFALLAVIVSDLVLISARVLLYPPFLQQPNSGFYLLEPVILLIVYAGIALALTHHPTADRRMALHVGTRLGLIAGLLWVISLAIETFANLTSPTNLISTAPFVLGGFVLWGVAGFRGARQTNFMSSGIVAAVWSGMITVLLTVTFGFLISLVALPRLTQHIAGSPEQISSGWQDLLAFAIANQFDAGFSHLLGALIIGSIVGAIGAVAAIMRSGTSQHPAIH